MKKIKQNLERVSMMINLSRDYEEYLNDLTYKELKEVIKNGGFTL